MMKKIISFLLGLTYSIVSLSQTCDALYFYHADSLFLSRDYVSRIVFEKDENGQYKQVIEHIFDKAIGWFNSPSIDFPTGKDTIRIEQPISAGDRIEISDKPFLNFMEKEQHVLDDWFIKLRLSTNLKNLDQIKCKVLSGEDAFLQWREFSFGSDRNRGEDGYTKVDLWFDLDRINNEEIGAVREVKLALYDELSDCSDTISIIFHNIAYDHICSRMCTSDSQGGICEMPFVGGASIPEIYIKTPDFIKRLPDRVEGDDRIVRLEFSPNPSEQSRGTNFDEDRMMEVGFDDPNNIYFCVKGSAMIGGCRVFQPGIGTTSSLEQKEALIALYNALDGEHWNNNNNWLSDKPVSEWYGVNRPGGNSYSYINTIYGNYIVALNLENNDLHGELPPQFSKLMDVPRGFLGLNNYEISNNRIYGDIPEGVKNHPIWSDIGWDLMEQKTTSWITDEKLNQADNKMKTNDAQVDLFVEEKESTVYDILKQNELTLVIDLGLIKDLAGFRLKDGNSISDDRVNLYLDYCNKGLGMVAVLGTYFDYPYDDYRAFVNQRQKEEGFRLTSKSLCLSVYH